MSSNNNKILINTLPKSIKPFAKFVRHKEQPAGLSTSRYLQDVTTCLIPKAVFSRSLADLTENTFLETTEEMLIYFAPALIGEKFARNLFSKVLPKNLKKDVAQKGVDLIEKAKTNVSVRENNKKILPIKAAIALTAMAIPLTEFCLNYIKNLMTIKLFNKSDFKNIASLENSTEDLSHQNKVKKSAKKHIALAAGVYSGCLALAGLLTLKGSKSKLLQKISEFILAPGNKIFKKNKKSRDFVNKYFCMDFDNQNGKLVLSKGQLTTCVGIGGIGYFGASADRGKENLKETATRFPIVGLYVITGSELVEKGFRKILYKFGKCRDLIDKNLNVPEFDKLDDIAKKLAQKRNTTVNQQYKSLVKQKILIAGAPFLFAIGVMGFFVAGMTNYFTKKRYENSKKMG